MAKIEKSDSKRNRKRTPETRQYYSLHEVADILGVTYLTVFRLCERGDLISIKLGGRRFIPKYTIDAVPLAPVKRPA